MTTFAFPAATNVFVPNAAATKKLTVNFARNPSKFMVNQWAQIIPVTQMAGLYRRVTIEEAGRITNATLDDHRWIDGNAAPTHEEGTESFAWLNYKCERYSYGYRLGDLTIDQADFDIIAELSATYAQQAMTARTQLAVTAITTQSNYDATHVVDATAVSFRGMSNQGYLTESTTGRLDIKRTLAYCVNLLRQDTLAALDPNDLRLVIGPDDAAVLAETQEIVDMVKHSPTAIQHVKSEGDFAWDKNNFYGLPSKLYGIPLLIEDAVKVSSIKGAATTTRANIWPAGTAVLCARPGSLEGVFGTPSFSTLALFVKEEMVVRTKKDVDNLRTLGQIYEILDAQVVAPVSGIVITNVSGT